ncbi:Unannotated [Lentimonas sp. CC19]|nr:Unannotated [Lentimonas sp. CC10]CAA6695513.1 Unannotated [Lentimonas sp. CC19]CAA7071722.1 Unannotated [Lentimonas sp. CC11]
MGRIADSSHGKPRIRHLWLEAEKRMAVAISRQFATDWWRIQTGRIFRT